METFKNFSKVEKIIREIWKRPIFKPQKITCPSRGMSEGAAEETVLGEFEGRSKRYEVLGSTGIALGLNAMLLDSVPLRLASLSTFFLKRSLFVSKKIYVHILQFRLV